MKYNHILLGTIFFTGSLASANEPVLGKYHDFNKQWQFTLTDSAKYTVDNYNTDSWRTLNVPHDWSVELPFDSIQGDGATGYLMGGIGWYSKTFDTPINSNQKCYIVFDGVYNNSEYWLNGRKLGEHPYGYAPFYFDITDNLKPEGENRLMVRVDRSRHVDSRWYTGSGIYRDVTMLVSDKLHIPVWGTFVTTPKVSKSSAQVNTQVELVNDYNEARKGVVITEYFNPEGLIVSRSRTSFNLKGGENKTLSQKATITKPELWDVETPNIYTAKTIVFVDGKAIDTRTTDFGIRSFNFDANSGFTLNGRNMKIKGVCLHHDAGLVGAAVPEGVWRRRLQILKEGGCNAIRTAHNPASEEFLALCDEMGFLVQEEFFDEWDNPKDKRLNMNERIVDYVSRGYTEHFQEWAEIDLKNTMKRSRNHPSIIQWSIGNEIEWTYPGNKESTGFFGADANGNYFWNPTPYSPEMIKEKWEAQAKTTYDIGETAQQLAEWTREMDTSRPVVANCILPSISYQTGYIDALDIAGFSYRRVMYDYAHDNYPTKPIMGTENLGQWHEWKAIEERDFVPGIFIWTGVDYMGERGGTRKTWPHKSTTSGLLDLAGFKKPSYYMYQSLWTAEPMIKMYTQTAEKSTFQKGDGDKMVEKQPGKWEKGLWVWHDVNDHWNYTKGQQTVVEAYSNCDQAELFLNGQSLGRISLDDYPDRIYKWAVPYQSGKLVVVGYKGKDVVEQELQTSKEPYAIRLTTDKQLLDADGEDVVHVVAELVDKDGNPVRNEDVTIDFSLDGACKLLGVDNGYSGCVTPFQTNSIKTHQGRCLLVLQATNQPGKIFVRAQTPKVGSNPIVMDVLRKF